MKSDSGQGIGVDSYLGARRSPGDVDNRIASLLDQVILSSATDLARSGRY